MDEAQSAETVRADLTGGPGGRILHTRQRRRGNFLRRFCFSCTIRKGAGPHGNEAVLACPFSAASARAPAAETRRGGAAGPARRLLREESLWI